MLEIDTAVFFLKGKCIRLIRKTPSLVKNKQYILLEGYYRLIKITPAMRETWVRSLGWRDPLEKGKATHSSILA